ncbi:unnamed protein product, partial [Clonostachys chloroleuca]
AQQNRSPGFPALVSYPGTSPRSDLLPERLGISLATGAPPNSDLIRCSNCRSRFALPLLIPANCNPQLSINSHHTPNKPIMLRTTFTKTASVRPLRAAFTTTVRAMGEGDTGAPPKLGGTGDAFQRREKASEDYAIRQREKEKLLELKKKLQEQKEHLERLSQHIDEITKDQDEKN